MQRLPGGQSAQHQAIGQRAMQIVSPNTAQSERWFGVAVMVLLVVFTVLVGSCIHCGPFQSYSARVLSIAAPFSASVHCAVIM